MQYVNLLFIKKLLFKKNINVLAKNYRWQQNQEKINLADSARKQQKISLKKIKSNSKT